MLFEQNYNPFKKSTLITPINTKISHLIRLYFYIEIYIAVIVSNRFLCGLNGPNAYSLGY